MKTQSPDTAPEVEARQFEMLRRASPARRAALMRGLSQWTMELSRRGLARARPHLNEQELNIEFVRMNYGEEVAEHLRRQMQDSGDKLKTNERS